MNFYRELINTIDDLILSHAKWDDGYVLSFDDLDDDYKGDLVHLKIENENRDVSDCFQQKDQYPKSDEITAALIGMLKSNCNLTRRKFAEIVRNNSINIHRDFLQSLIDERCADLSSDLRKGRLI